MHVFTSLKTRIAAIVLLLFLGCIWLVTYLTTSRLESEFAGVLANQQFASASYTASEVEQKLKLRFDMMAAVAKEITPDMMASSAALHQLLANRPVLLSRFDGGVVVISKEGRGLADFPELPGRATAAFAEQPYFRDTMATGQPTLGKPQVGRFSKKLGVIFTAPIRNADDQIIGLLAALATLDDPAFVGNIHHARVGASGWIAINDARHRLIVAINDPKRVLQPFPKPGVNKMLDKYADGYEGSGTSINSQGREVLSSAKKVGDTGWFVQLVLPTDEAYAPIHEMKRRAYLLAVVLSIVATLIVWIVIRQLLKSLDAATQDIQRITRGEEKLRKLPVSRQDEVGELLDSFNQLFEQRHCLEQTLERQARTDYLTGLSNRRYFFEMVTQEMARMARYGGTASLLMLDIDNFKQVNDTHGHKMGDLVLQKLAETCRTTLREIDFTSRFGGEEFAILLPGTDCAGAVEIAERLREAMASAAVVLDEGEPLHFTVSIGVSCFKETANNVDAVLHEADCALYEAKNLGRNRVCGGA